MEFDYSPVDNSTSEKYLTELKKRVEGTKALVEEKLNNETEYIHHYPYGGSYGKYDKLKTTFAVVKFTKEDGVIKVSIEA